MNHPENDVAITPQRGTINPGKGEKIQVTVTPKQSGFYELTVEYFIRPSSLASSTIPLSKPKHLCILNGMCYLPTLQVYHLLLFLPFLKIKKMLKMLEKFILFLGSRLNL